MSYYNALVDGQVGAYGVVVPDLPGCCSGGATTEEAALNAGAAISLWTDEMIARGGEIPAPRDMEAAMNDPEIAAAIGAGSALAFVPLVHNEG